jgi:hydrophobe/amphiphile efflux-1 (HAE1) family protein
MISRFFIDRPIFAAVLSIVITLAGGVAVFSLPITQYPSIAPPTVQVAVSYPGASAQVVADTIGAPIEQQVNGVQNMLYMSSQSANDGSYTLTVTFDLGTDLNTALVMVQNRVALAMPQLPDTVQKQGLVIKKKSPDILMVINFYSPNGRYDSLYLSNYATINVKDVLFRVPGVSDITYLGQRDYSVRAWLDPQLLASRSMTAGEVALAIASQNQPMVGGVLGANPGPTPRGFQPPLDALGRLSDPKQYEEIILKVVQNANNGFSPQVVRLRDVAHVEFGAQNYNLSCTLDGKPSVGLGVYQLPGTNALDVADLVKQKMLELKTRFPDGVDYEIAYDTTPFISESVGDVVRTLFEAVFLVGLVVLVFLQNWRAALIPLLAVPVAIIGTFAVMALLGFSLNNISLLGMVLAISIVVDDAIVVVENVERWLEHGMSARDAAHRAMDEVTSPVIAVALVLSAVFIPCAFISGITGQFFRQFAVTIAVSTIISAFNSLTLSPALSAVLLTPRGTARDPVTWLLDHALGWFFRLFNSAFAVGTTVYTRIVARMIRMSFLSLVVYAGLLGLTYWLFQLVPAAFIPQQDMGRLIVNVQLPDSASVQRTQAVLARLDAITRKTPGVRHVVGISGMSFVLSANSSNFGSMFVVLDPFAERRGEALGANAIIANLQAAYAREVREAIVTVFGAAPVPGLGVAGGFKMLIEDRGSLGFGNLQKQADSLTNKIKREPGMVGVLSMFRSNAPQLYMDIDRSKVKSLGISLADVNQTLQIYLGSEYVNSFNAFGRFWQVNIMADGVFRDRVSDINLIKIRNNLGQMVPLGTLVSVRDMSGPATVIRYNLFNAAPINGNFYPGQTVGDPIATIKGLADESLPRSMKTEWTELTYMQIRAGNTAMYVFALAVVFVFLALAALYESWALPLAVILVVPMCLLCSLIGIALVKMPLNIFVQIGLIVLVGLACKNAILIVEFSKQLTQEGRSRHEAIEEACRLRLRPILMTSFAFILGVVPLIIATGAGAEMRRALGTAVFSGMLGVTLFGIFLTPVFFNVIHWFSERPLMESLPMRWMIAFATSGAAGAAIGFLLWKLGWGRLSTSLFFGGCLGLATAALVLRLKHRRLKKSAMKDQL